MLLALLPQCIILAEQDIPYGIGSWQREILGNHLGNHRACVTVSRGGRKSINHARTRKGSGSVDLGAVLVHIPWRLRISPVDNDIIVIDAKTGKRVSNVARIDINREFGDLAFEPVTVPGKYYLYYFPHKKSKEWMFEGYTSPQTTADSSWLAKFGLAEEDLRRGKWKTLPEATVVEIQARTEFDRFDPMEVAAHDDEVKQLLTEYPDEQYLLFPEDRKLPIRMFEHLPVHWIRNGQREIFYGQAQPGEFYVFQIGLYAAGGDVKDLDMIFDSLRSGSGPEIPSCAFRCFNLGGVDATGVQFKSSVSVEHGKVQPLWVGVQIPSDAKGAYAGTLQILPKNGGARKVKVALKVSGSVLLDSGDSELWRMSRLRWLDSTIAQDDEVTSPYTPLQRRDRTIACLGREVQFGKTGLPERMTSNGQDILTGPLDWVVEKSDGRIAWKPTGDETIKSSNGLVIRRSDSTGGGFHRTTWAEMEFDGYIAFKVILKAEKSVHVKDIRLEIPISSNIATYMMGMGRRGDLRPKRWEWTWRADHPNNQIWIGDVNAGLRCKLQGPDDVFGSNGMPAAWVNDGQGRVVLSEDGGQVLLSAHSGSRSFKAGEEMTFCFSILPTPLKPVDLTAHWNRRHWNPVGWDIHVSKIVAWEANRAKVHHGGSMNPTINYPFIATEALKNFVNEAHEEEIKVPLYYTVRELSNHCAELWVLRSLGHEVLRDGRGGGDSWLREHLISGYHPRWQELMYPTGEIDAAVGVNYRSRWHNYYLEGLAWLLKNVGIDGIYLDGIGFDREVMKRERKILDRYRLGSEVDFHCGDGFHKYWHGWENSVNMCKFMEHLPYIDSLWFGEGYHYNNAYATPANWLVEISGLAFGLSNEMLQGGGNPWKGMLYGMTNRNSVRYRYQKPLWDIWDSFGIQDAQMTGYWDKTCPVKTSHPDIKATVFVKKDKVMIALASWATTLVNCQLKIDFNTLGLDPKTTKLHAPQILDLPSNYPKSIMFPSHYQEHERWFEPSEKIPVEPGKGWLLIGSR